MGINRIKPAASKTFVRPLASQFLSEETGEPFRHCAACGIPLLEIDRPWLVTKEYRAGECVEEYAVCETCRDQLTDRIPEPTKARIREFLETEIDWDRQVQKLVDGEDRLANCIRCQTPREELSGYTLSAAFDSSGEMIEGPLPLLMCSECCENFQSLLCDGGQRVWRDFCDQHLRSQNGGSGPMIL